MAFQEPNYESSIFKSLQKGADFVIPEDVFDELWNDIYVEDVIETTIDGVMYHAYSQAVPNGTTDRSEINYCLVFLVPISQSYAADTMDSI